MSDIIDDLISNRTFNNPNRHISNINQRLDERNDVYGNFNSRKKLAFNPPIHEDPNRTYIAVKRSKQFNITIQLSDL